MRACAAFEDQLVDYHELADEERLRIDNHVDSCGSCREYLMVLDEIDATLLRQVRRVHLDLQRVTEIRRGLTVASLRGVSHVSEWLDFVAALAVLAFAGGLAWQAGLLIAVLDALTATN